MRFARSILALLLVTPAGLLAQAQGRLYGTVLDAEGKPLEGVTATLLIKDTSFSLEETTNKKGEFKMTVVDSTQRFVLQLEKEGFQTRSEEIDIPMGKVLRGQWGLDVAGPSGSSLDVSAAVDGNRAAVATFNEGVTAFNAGDNATALVKFEEARTLDPTIKQVYEVLATLYVEAGRHDDALAAAATLAELEPGSRIAVETRFDVSEAKGDRAAANAEIDRLLELYPDAATGRRAFNVGVLAARANDDAKARRYLEAAARLLPDLLQAKSVLMLVHKAAGRHDEALALADEVIAADPQNTQAWTTRYEVYKAKGDKAKADEAYAKVFAANPEAIANALYEDGKKAFEGGNTARALELLTKLLELSPDHPRGHYFMGLALVSAGRIPEAKTHLERFIEIAPADQEAGTAREMLKAL